MCVSTMWVGGERLLGSIEGDGAATLVVVVVD